ncbi:polysaccharide deacetylase family protein, partial [Enterococcus faecium]
PFLSWEDITQLKKDHWEFGSHGVEHLDLTRQTPEVLRNELLQSKQMIELQLQQPCAHFAYTWGRYTPLLQKMLPEAEYTYAASAVHG